MRILQISDTHLFANARGTLLGVNTQHSFQAVLQQSASEAIPDIVLLTGDLAQDPSPAAYKRLAKQVLETFDCPIYWIPGNHDNPIMMQEVFAKTKIRQEKMISQENWQIILLDSHFRGHVAGHIAQKDLAWLDRCLTEQPNRHSLVVLHHHPIPVNCRWLDNIGLKNNTSFLNIIDRHPHVKCVLWGHIHQEFSTTRNGIPYLATPSTCIQFLPKQDDFALDPAFPGYRWLDLLKSGKVKSKVMRLKNFKQTIDFSSAGY